MYGYPALSIHELSEQGELLSTINLALVVKESNQ